MRVHGELLTPSERDRAVAPFHKNDGKQWDLHEMSLYVQKGYAAIAADADTSSVLKKGMENLRQGQSHE